MEGTLVFCKDGILRLQSGSDESRLVPLVSIQKYLGQENYPFFLRQLRSAFVLEDGVTMGSFLLCLEPWAEVASAITDRQVDKYIAELRKPSAEAPCFDWIEIRKTIHFSREMIFEECPEGMDFIDFLNRPNKTVEYADAFKVSHEYSICGAKEGDPSNWSCSASIHKLKNVPLIFNREPLAIANANLFRPDAPGVKPNADWKESSYVPCVEDEHVSALELVEIVIAQGLWFDTPQGAMREAAFIEAIVAELPEDLSELVEVDEEDVTEVEEETQKRISIAPGAFDSLIEHSNRERSEWEQMMDVVESTSQFPFRIGKVEEGKAKDNRAYGKFFE